LNALNTNNFVIKVVDSLLSFVLSIINRAREQSGSLILSGSVRNLIADAGHLGLIVGVAKHSIDDLADLRKLSRGDDQGVRNVEAGKAISISIIVKVITILRREEEISPEKF